jgi:GDPmannose 4,6-dehydratase
MNKVFIIGGTGQFGFYLSKLLLNNTTKIYITSRNIHSTKIKFFKNIFKNRITFIKLDIYNKKKIYFYLKNIKPNYIFYLAGQSSVFKSFKKSKETLKSNFDGCKNVLDILVQLNIDAKFFNASSSEMFGNIKDKITIHTQKRPVSPYGKAKLKAYNLVRKYRKKFNLELYNGVIFNCESYIRPNSFVIPKICLSAIQAKVATSQNKKIFFKFGNLNIKRDFGWCEEYVKYIWKYMHSKNYDFIIATGKTYSLKKLLNEAFKFFKLDWRKYIIEDKNFYRKKEITSVEANIQYLKLKYKNIPKINGTQIVKKLVRYYLINNIK